MRPVRLNSSLSSGLIPLAFILLGGCTSHGLRCDAHLTPINAPEHVAMPGTMPPHSKPSDKGSP